MTRPGAATAAHLSRFPDLSGAPFTLPGSRLLVFRSATGDETLDALTVRTAEYEQELDDCVVIDRLRVLDASGAAMAVTEVAPARIVFGSTVALTFAGVGALSVGVIPDAVGTSDAWSLELRAPLGAEPDTSGWRLGLPSAPALQWRSRLKTTHDGALVVFSAGDRNNSVLVVTGTAPVDDAGHAAHLEQTAAIWQRWFARCPVVRDELQAMTRDCWWVLGANIVELPGQGNARAVVPSKIGYVGLWQWDAYFIAAGLRHGDPELAREQLDLALRHPTADGQLPDVVYDGGVLASSDDLPVADRERLRRHGSAAADPRIPVPLTKPPLAAWAVEKVAEKLSDPTWEAHAYEVIAGSQEWWFARQDSDGDGMPEYSHPYSSGLDDCPVFDGPLPVASPDLATYLIVQDELLARRAERAGELERASSYRRRAERTLALLLESWDDSDGFFHARGGNDTLETYTAVSLLPLLTGRLPGAIRERMLADLDDRAKFATPFAVPTVAACDPDFSPERMWRGPVWVNINALLIEGLRASGEVARARALAEHTVRLVIEAGGPHEYFNPETGQKAKTATTAFGWSAALFIDLAVALSE